MATVRANLIALSERRMTLDSTVAARVETDIRETTGLPVRAVHLHPDEHDWAVITETGGGIGLIAVRNGDRPRAEGPFKISVYQRTDFIVADSRPDLLSTIEAVVSRETADAGVLSSA